MVIAEAVPHGRSGAGADDWRADPKNHRSFTKGGSMPRKLLIEEYHLSLFIPRHLSVTAVARARRTLRSPSFERRLRQAVTAAASEFTALNPLTVKISR